MTVTAEVVADSCAKGKPWQRIATIKVHFPRYILAEVNTHRVFSRSYSSSRAIPTKRMVAMIRKDPAMPESWGQNKAGMQAGMELDGWRLAAVKTLWLGGMWLMTTLALLAARVGVHKQVVNRMIEPWAHATGVITSTEWANFFALRRHHDADPTFKRLAYAIYQALLTSVPRELNEGEWHLPFVTREDEKAAFFATVGGSDERGKLRDRLLVVSTARCARASYGLFDGAERSSYEDDLKLVEKLKTSKPAHASPFEHQATPKVVAEEEFVHNLRGWRSQRSMMPEESVPGWPKEMIYKKV